MSDLPPEAAVTPHEVETRRERLAAVIRPDAELPSLPFTEDGGSLGFADSAYACSDDLGRLLASLATAYQDTAIVVAPLEPSASDYHRQFGYCPILQFDPNSVASRFRQVLAYEPREWLGTGIAWTAGRLGMVGTGSSWAIWSDRDWDMLIMRTEDADGPWTKQGIPFVSAREALEEFTFPDVEAVPWTDRRIARFVEELARRYQITV